MNILDQDKKIKKLDSQGMWQSIESLGLQCQQAWEDVKALRLPDAYRNVTQVVINGMGGSGLGGHIIEAVYGGQLKVPYKITNSYRLPGSVNQKTLCLLSSYSGTTEEVLATLAEARRKKAKILIICAGGTLAKLAKRWHIPAYVFNPHFNPCGQPRMGLGYSVVGMLALLRRCGLIHIPEAEISKAIKMIVSLHRQFGLKVRSSRNKAKLLARRLYQRVPVIVAAEHLSGNAHVMANQLNENSKNFSAYFLVSELNHHLMEGLRFPKANKQNLHFLLIESKRYQPVIQKRFRITRNVLAKSRIPYSVYATSGATALAQVFETLLIGSYVNFYLAMLNQVDPSPIPFVDYFKKELSKG